MNVVYSVAHPIFLGAFIGYFSYGSDFTLIDAFWYATGLAVALASHVYFFAPVALFMYTMNCKVRVACGGLIYRKALRILKSSAKEGQTGKIINLLSNDVRKFDEAFILIHELWRGPFECLSFLIVIYMEIGVSAFVGMGFLICFIPLQCKNSFCIFSFISITFVDPF